MDLTENSFLLTVSNLRVLMEMKKCLKSANTTLFHYCGRVTDTPCDNWKLEEATCSSGMSYIAIFPFFLLKQILIYISLLLCTSKAKVCE